MDGWMGVARAPRNGTSDHGTMATRQTQDRNIRPPRSRLLVSPWCLASVQSLIFVVLREQYLYITAQVGLKEGKALGARLRGEMGEAGLVGLAIQAKTDKQPSVCRCVAVYGVLAATSQIKKGRTIGGRYVREFPTEVVRASGRTDKTVRTEP